MDQRIVVRNYEFETCAQEIVMLDLYIDVTYYIVQHPMGKHADSDIDCRGYVDIDYTIHKATLTGTDIELTVSNMEFPRALDKLVKDTLEVDKYE